MIAEQSSRAECYRHRTWTRRRNNWKLKAAVDGSAQQSHKSKNKTNKKIKQLHPSHSTLGWHVFTVFVRNGKGKGALGCEEGLRHRIAGLFIIIVVVLPYHILHTYASYSYILFLLFLAPFLVPLSVHTRLRGTTWRMSNVECVVNSNAPKTDPQTVSAWDRLLSHTFCLSLFAYLMCTNTCACWGSWNPGARFAFKLYWFKTDLFFPPFYRIDSFTLEGLLNF